MAKATNSRAESAAITLVEKEYKLWRDATAFVTPKIAFNVRVLIETLRKNYYGIFDEPTDPVTGHKKIFFSITEAIVDAVVKNIDLDTKDINLRAKRPEAFGLTAFVRSIVRNKLEEIHFGEMLDEFERFLAVDGTAVWKTYLLNDGGKKRIRVVRPDLLNLAIDPTAKNMQEATVIERAVMTVDEVKAMDGWDNTDDVTGSDVSRNDDALNQSSGSDTNNLVEVYERWGFMPKSLITGNEKDTDMVEGHIVVSGINGKISHVHLIEENTTKDFSGAIIKPYEEGWYMKALNRWHGRGPAEKIMMLQIYLNTVMNVRINRARVAQLGIFKVRKNSGVTSQMLSRLASNGVITVNDPSDVEQMVINESSASYNDERVVTDWAARLTSAFESATGEQLPSSTPATNAVLQNRSAQSQFVMVKEGIGMFLQRWLTRHFIPKIAETITKGDIVRMTGSVEELRNMDSVVANTLVKQKVDELMANGQIPNPQDVMKERDRVKEKLAGTGESRYVEIMKKPDFSMYDVAIDITNEEIDKGVLVQNLLQALNIAGAVPDSGINMKEIIGNIFDIMGLDSTVVRQGGTPGQQAPQAPQQAKQVQVPNPTAQSTVTAANTM